MIPGMTPELESHARDLDLGLAGIGHVRNNTQVHSQCWRSLDGFKMAGGYLTE
jgi:hypothetical protein